MKFSILFILLLSYGVVFAQKKEYVFDIQSKSNSQIKGKVFISINKENQVVLRVKAKNLKPGKHGIHVHSVGDCSASDASSAGGHWNPYGKKHGLCQNGCDSSHLGDMGNLQADKKGKVNFVFITKEWCVNCSDSLKNINHKALIIHENVDDLTTQSTGNSGGRIGCTVFDFSK